MFEYKLMIWKDPRLILIENNPVYKPYAKCLNINKNNQVAFTKTVTTNFWPNNKTDSHNITEIL
jgi:hypothetical protein